MCQQTEQFDSSGEEQYIIEQWQSPMQSNVKTVLQASITPQYNEVLPIM